MSALGFEKTTATLDRMVGKRVDLWVNQRGGAAQRLNLSGVLESGVPIDPDSPEADWNGPGTVRYRFEDIDGWGLLIDPKTFSGSSELVGGLAVTMQGGLEIVIAESLGDRRLGAPRPPNLSPRP